MLDWQKKMTEIGEWKKKSKKSPLSHTGAFGSPVGWPLIGKVSQEMLVAGHPSQTQEMC